MENGKRKMENVRRRGGGARRVIFCVSICLLPFSICHVPGCAENKPPSTQPTSMEDRQNAAMNDPMNYKPQFGNGDISGGDINHFDRDGFNKDLHDVLNP
ncbi:MAG TPA: hypothetical protein VLI90_05400 [Tepidisphaeraceae bacterium]|nr:hypothetical protein [Tepidisphaeraceae bacterium]